MAQEIEHRFLLAAMPDLGGSKPESIVQGYLLKEESKVVRIRRIGLDAFITIKGPKIDGAGDEFEYPIPVKDAEQMLIMCGEENTLSKLRYQWMAPDKKIWEVDKFTGRHEGLYIAELEVDSINAPYFEPDWLKGSFNITTDKRFFNAKLVEISRTEMIANIASVLKP